MEEVIQGFLKDVPLVFLSIFNDLIHFAEATDMCNFADDTTFLLARKI